VAAGDQPVEEGLPFGKGLVGVRVLPQLLEPPAEELVVPLLVL